MYKLFKKRHTPEFLTQIPHKASFQLKTESFGHKFNENWRLFRREISLCMSGQKFLECGNIPENTQRILWIATSIKNIGDAVMALSGRKLLIDKGYQLDVLLDEKVYPLFINDDWFSQVYTDVNQIDANYDLILLDSVKSISLKTKKKYFSKVPYCHFRGHFDGIEFNWILYSFHRINALLGYPYEQKELDCMAFPELKKIKSEVVENQLVIAVGGEDEKRRVYDKWVEVVDKLLIKYPQLTIILAGNANALSDADKISGVFGDRVINKVNMLNLAETAQLIASSGYFLGCDGGLMHIASGYGLKGVALFGYFEPEYRLPLLSHLTAVYDESSVKNIPVDQISQKLIELIAKGVQDD